MSENDEFYIGYESGMPPAIRRHVTIAIVAVSAACLGAALVFVSQERQLADSRFEFGNTRAFTGYLSLSPAPVLIVVDDRDGPRLHWLVARGKRGAAALLGSAEAGWVTLNGTLIERERWRMIELAEGSVRRQAIETPRPRLEMAASRPVVLTGEIVDGKCYLGVMNPGERTVHRDCAVRCLSGGVPAMFAYRDNSGPHLALVLGTDGIRAEDVGRRITLSGQLSGADDALVLSLSGTR